MKTNDTNLKFKDIKPNYKNCNKFIISEEESESNSEAKAHKAVIIFRS